MVNSITTEKGELFLLVPEYLKAREGVTGQREARRQSCPSFEAHRQNRGRLVPRGSGAALRVQGGASCPPTLRAGRYQLPADAASCRWVCFDWAGGSSCSWPETTVAWRESDWRKKKERKRRSCSDKKKIIFIFFNLKKVFIFFYAEHLLVHVQLECQSLRFLWQIPAATCIKLVKVFFFFLFF